MGGAYGMGEVDGTTSIRMWEVESVSWVRLGTVSSYRGDHIHRELTASRRY